MFEELTPERVKNNEFTVTLQPKALYSFTTTTGQHKAVANPPEDKPFPFPYRADFDNEPLGATPAYFSDQGGAFEVVQREDRKGNCLRQVITRNAIEWERAVINQTVLGDTLWKDYTVGCDVYFTDPYSYASVMSRVTEMHRSHKKPDAYILKLQSSGKWNLMAGSKELASGFISLKGKTWHSLVLQTSGSQVKAVINGIEVSTLDDTSFSHGMAGIGSSFTRVDFDNFVVK